MLDYVVGLIDYIVVAPDDSLLVCGGVVNVGVLGLLLLCCG